MRFHRFVLVLRAMYFFKYIFFIFLFVLLFSPSLPLPVLLLVQLGPHGGTRGGEFLALAYGVITASCGLLVVCRGGGEFSPTTGGPVSSASNFSSFAIVYGRASSALSGTAHSRRESEIFVRPVRIFPRWKDDDREIAAEMRGCTEVLDIFADALSVRGKFVENSSLKTIHVKRIRPKTIGAEKTCRYFAILLKISKYIDLQRNKKCKEFNELAKRQWYKVQFFGLILTDQSL